MLHIEPIDSLDRPELAPYRTMKWQSEHRQQGIFVAEGEKVVERLVDGPLEVISLLLPAKALGRLEEKLSARREDIRAFVAGKEVLEKLTGFSMYQGVMAVGKVPQPLSLEEIYGFPDRPRLFVAVDGLSNAENLGALVRNCVAFGVHALLVGETSSSPYLRRAVRNSMGAIFQLPSIELSNLGQTISLLREKGMRCVAAHPHTNRFVTEEDLTSDCCVVFGSEGEGLSRSVLERCDTAAAIPMSSKVDSLNVGSAAAAFLYEVRRQRMRPVNPRF